jgi:type VI secretion system protein ImpJ
MKLLSRVIWSEGMQLAPHHFQTQIRYFEDAIHFAVSSLWFRPYGLAACEMDDEAIENGTITLRHARGFFPDGLSFYVPGPDPPPDPRPIASSFSPVRDSHIVLLAVPAGDAGGDSGFSGMNGPRFIADTRFVADETHGGDERAIGVGRKNLQLLLDVEATDNFTTLPLARVRRTGTGRFEYDPAFIPPLLSAGASPPLIAMLRALCDLLDEKSRSIADAAASADEALPDTYRRDLPGFLLRQTIHSSLGALRHQLLAKRGHPEEIYELLARLGGALCCFTMDAHPRDLPLYDHDNLTECFAALDRKIRDWLELMLPVNCVTVPLRPAAPWLWAAAIDPEHTSVPSRWILEMRSKADEATVITTVPRLVKVCSEKFVPELVKRALPGMTLSHLPVPPPAVPQAVDAQYFSITRSGPCWDHIVQSKRIGVYVPADLPEPQMRLHILLEQ